MIPRSWMARFAYRRAIVRRQVTALLALVLILSAGSTAHAEKRIALVIGNERYENISYVPKAEADARAVADKLKTLGFEQVLVEINANRGTMAELLKLFASWLDLDDLAVVYFVGNGIVINSENLLLPVDVPAARAKHEAVVTHAAFRVEDLLTGLRDRGSRVLFLIDASRDNPFDRPGVRALELGTGLARFSALPAMTSVLVSASPNEKARVKTNNLDTSPHSLFGRALVSQLVDMTIGELAGNVRRHVREISERRQTPVFYSNGVGRLYLSGRSGGKSGENIQFKSKPDGSKRFTASEVGTMVDELPAREECVTLGRKFADQLGGESAQFWVRIGRGDVGLCKRKGNDWLVEWFDRNYQDAMVLEFGK